VTARLLWAIISGGDAVRTEFSDEFVRGDLRKVASMWLAEGRFTGNALNGQQRSQLHVPAQVGDMRELIGPGQTPPRNAKAYSKGW
jgi:hypothetical protein